MAGITFLFIGIFCPVMYFPVVGNITPLNFQGFWMDLSVVCIAAFIVLQTNIKKVWLILIGLGSFFINIYYFYKFHTGSEAAKSELIKTGDSADAMLNLIGESIGLKWGWLLLFLGSILLIIAGSKEYKSLTHSS